MKINKYVSSNSIFNKCFFIQCSSLTCDTNGPILFFRDNIFPRDFSMIDGKDSNLSVCPVGAVSNTTTEKSILLTSLKKGKVLM